MKHAVVWVWAVGLSLVAAQYGPPAKGGVKKHRTTTTTTEQPGALSNEITGPFPLPNSSPDQGSTGSYGGNPPGGEPVNGGNYWWSGPNSPFSSGAQPPPQPQQPTYPQPQPHPQPHQPTYPQPQPHPQPQQPTYPQPQPHPQPQQPTYPQPQPQPQPQQPTYPQPQPHPQPQQPSYQPPQQPSNPQPRPPPPSNVGCGGPAGCTGVGTDPHQSPTGKPVDIAQNPFLSSAILGKPIQPSNPQGCQGTSGGCQVPQYPGQPTNQYPTGQPPHPGSAQYPGSQNKPGYPQPQPTGYPSQPQSPSGPHQYPSQPQGTTGPNQYPSQPQSPTGPNQYPSQSQSPNGPSQYPRPGGPPAYPGQPQGPSGPAQYPSQPQGTSGSTQYPRPSGPSPYAGQPEVSSGPAQYPRNPQGASVPLRPQCSAAGHACVPSSMCVNGVISSNGMRQLRDPESKECIPGLEACCRLPTGGAGSVPVTPQPDYQRPYTGPLNTTPYPGCAAALKCVAEIYCTAEGVMADTPVVLTREQADNRVPITDCSNPDTGIIGKCCRDPNYKDPWPAGMMMMKNPGDYDDGQYHGEGSGPGANIAPTYNSISPTPHSPSKDHGPKPSIATGGLNKPFPPPYPGNTPSGSPYTAPQPTGSYQPNQPSGTPYQPPQSQSGPYQPTQPSSYQPGSSPYQPGQPSGTPNQPRQPSGNPNQPGQHSSNPYQPGQPSTSPYQPPSTPYQQGHPSSTPYQPGPSPDSYQPGQPIPQPLPTHPGQSQPALPTPQDQAPPPQPPGPAPGSSCGIRRPGGSGDAAGFGEFPWQALVVSAGNRSHLCGAAIIAENAIVTAAHCINQLKSRDLLVKAGEWKLLAQNPEAVQIRPVAAVARHPGYDVGSLTKDLAVLVLNQPFTLSVHVDKICLPSSSPGSEYIQRPGQTCVLTGWGKTALQGPIQGSDLHKVDVNLVPAKQCEAKLKSTPNLGKYFILQEGSSCALPPNPEDLCKVDFGSGVACEREDGHYELTGVNSWDLSCQARQPLPAVVAACDTDWIGKVLATPLPELQEQEEAYNQGLLKGENVDGVDVDDKPGFSQGYGK